MGIHRGDPILSHPGTYHRGTDLCSGYRRRALYHPWGYREYLPKYVSEDVLDAGPRWENGLKLPPLPSAMAPFASSFRGSLLLLRLVPVHLEDSGAAEKPEASFALPRPGHIRQNLPRGNGRSGNSRIDVLQSLGLGGSKSMCRKPHPHFIVEPSARPPFFVRLQRMAIHLLFLSLAADQGCYLITSVSLKRFSLILSAALGLSHPAG